MFLDHWLSWTILVTFLLGLGYAMIVIGQEKESYRDSSVPTPFFGLLLPIASWWSCTNKTKNFMKYERTDTRYDWFCTYEYIDSDQNLEEVFDNLLEEMKIAFDPDVAVETESKHLFKDQELAQKFSEALRVEGKATQDIDTRAYLDIYLLREENSVGYYKFLSRSSVLNGSVEGPYFEESIYNAKES